MKFINYLKSIDGISIYPMITLILFGMFFLVILLWVSKANQKYIKDAKNIPLKD